MPASVRPDGWCGARRSQADGWRNSIDDGCSSLQHDVICRGEWCGTLARSCMCCLVSSGCRRRSWLGLQCWPLVPRACQAAGIALPPPPAPTTMPCPSPQQLLISYFHGDRRKAAAAARQQPAAASSQQPAARRLQLHSHLECTLISSAPLISSALSSAAHPHLERALISSAPSARAHHHLQHTLIWSAPSARARPPLTPSPPLSQTRATQHLQPTGPSLPHLSSPHQ